MGKQSESFNENMHINKYFHCEGISLSCYKQM